MACVVLDGNAVFREIKIELRARIEALRTRGVVPGLGTVLVGDDAGSAKYVGMKHRNCRELGVASIHAHLPATCTQAELEAVIDAFNADPEVDAYLVQYPIPKGLDYARASLRVDPDKDVDGLHPVNLGRLVMGERGPRPCTPAGIQRLLVEYDVPIEGRTVVIIGRGLTVGKPLANLLSLKEPNANAAVTLLHTGVTDIRPYVEAADIVVAAAGAPGIVTKQMVKPGAAVVQTGTTIVDGDYLPDVDDDVQDVAGWFSPVILSVGPMTRASLFENCVSAAERRAATAP
jgi:methylenetetrahydrofolate dehydrogenase (NADP+) / methenyltetrahydrofolate cyclohydrolase